MATHASIKNGLAGILAGRRTWLPPENFYLGLSTNTIASDGTGIVEPASTSGYARVQIVNSDASFAAPVGGAVTNTVDFHFNEITEYAGIARDWFIASAATGSNAIIWGKFATGDEKTLQAGLTIHVNVGNLKFNIFDA